MEKPVFAWSPDEGAEEEIKPNVTVTGFGDGYEQRVANGINPEEMAWSLTFTGDCGMVIPIRDFLRARGATEGFIWSNPFDERDVYVARELRVKKLKPEVMQVSVKFERVNESFEVL